MSSILEALKKLETDKDEQSEEFTWPQSVNAKEALNSRFKEGGLFKHPALVFFSVAFIVVCLFIFADNKKRSIVPLVPDLPVEQPGEPVEKEMAVQVKSRVLAKPPEYQKMRETDSSDGPPPVVMENRLEQNKTELPALSKENTTPSDMESRSFEAENSEIESFDEMTEEAEEYVSEVYNSIPKEMLPPKKMVDDNWLKLHAISWSEDPGRRIAVINSVIVKEGRVVDGGLVSRIDRDYVVIVKGGEEFMLPFGLR